MPKNTRARGATNAELDGTDEPEQQPPADDDAAAEVPARSADKATWVDHARGLGADDEVVAGSKAEIQAWVDAQG